MVNKSIHAEVDQSLTWHSGVLESLFRKGTAYRLRTLENIFTKLHLEVFSLSVNVNFFLSESCLL